MRLALVAALLLLVPAAAARADSEPDKLLRYGEQLAQECTTCHRRDGKDEGIPSIMTMSADDIVSTLMLYKSGRRKSKVMVSVAASLDETQLRAIAEYFASLPKPPEAPPVPPKPKALSRSPEKDAAPAGRP